MINSKNKNLERENFIVHRCSAGVSQHAIILNSSECNTNRSNGRFLLNKSTNFKRTSYFNFITLFNYLCQFN